MNTLQHPPRPWWDTSEDLLAAPPPMVLAPPFFGPGDCSCPGCFCHSADLRATVLIGLAAGAVAKLTATTPAAAHMVTLLATTANVVATEGMNIGWIDWALHEQGLCGRHAGLSPQCNQKRCPQTCEDSSG
ncbi:hypothetical protein mRhiFer1_010311 [Rhinolophus ferrumequinum]|uniref:Uncharacterized protein n=1 Tax=Rhinolophus ferrumequinum TaxID=59479 RepID=A0A7J7X5H4_RHIFE|nr:hypothetical protein mRhiFer1_010311 [Rhinolophus ferrumequinum]